MRHLRTVVVEASERCCLRLPQINRAQHTPRSYPDIDPLEDLNTELERKLGAMVKDKYGTDFYILYKFPQRVSCCMCTALCSCTL